MFYTNAALAMLLDSIKTYEFSTKAAAKMQLSLTIDRKLPFL